MKRCLQLLSTLLAAVLISTGLYAQDFELLLVENFNATTIPTSWISAVQDPAMYPTSGPVMSDGWEFGVTSYSGIWNVPVSLDNSGFAISNDDPVDQDRSDDFVGVGFFDMTNYDSLTILFDRYFDAQYGSAGYFYIANSVEAVIFPLSAVAQWEEDGYNIVNGEVLVSNPFVFDDQMVVGFLHNDNPGDLTDGNWGDGLAIDNVILAGWLPPCENTVLYPSTPVTVDAGGAVTTINTLNYEEEYSVVTGITSGNYYEVTSSNGGGYITVREGSVGGPILATGFSPVQFTASSASDVYIHWNVDANCGTDNSVFITTTIQDLGLPPCENLSLYPGSAVTPDAGGAVTTIATDLYAGSEYSVITGVLTGHEYEFTHANGSYITVRVGAVDGPVLGSGYSPLTVQATGSSDLYVHWNVDDACATSATGSYLGTVQDLGVPTCNNDPIGGIWPSSAVTVDGFNLTEIAGCNYEDEYSVVNGIVTGGDYTFTSVGGGGYITVTIGAVDGPVLGAGYSPLSVTATGTDDLYIHWTLDEFCNTVGSSPCVATAVQRNCTADAGTSTADATPVCMSGGSATVAVTPNGDQVVPTGYASIALLADASGNILGGGMLSYTVNAPGDYYVHMGVIDPADQLAYSAETTIAGVHALTLDGGGSLCGSVDQAGTLVTVNEEPTATISGGGLSCDGATVNVQIDFTGTGPWSVNYTDPVGVVDLSGVTDNPLIIASSDAGSFSLNSVSDANCPGTVSGTATITSGATPDSDFTSSQVAGTLSVDFADASTATPAVTSWLWDFGDGNTSIMQNPTHTYTVEGTYAVCMTVTNDCGTDSSCSAVEVLLGPANDECSGATSLTQGATCAATSGTLAGATESAAPCSGGDVADDVWFSFMATETSAMVDVAGSADVDAVFEVYSGTCGVLTSLGCTDDGFSSGDPESTQLSGLTIGETYYIRVYHYFSNSFSVDPTDPTFDICVYELPAPPANDDVCNAIGLSMGANGPYSNESATAEVGEPVPPAGTGGLSCESQDGWCAGNLAIENSIWFTFMAPASGNVTIDTDGSDDDTQLAVYSAVSCQDFATGSAVLLGANDDNVDFSITEYTSLVTLCGLTPGQTYFVQVDGYNGASGDVLVNLTETTVDAGFTYSATGLTVDFTDASTSSSTIVEWAWDFGDGNTSSMASPTHTYAADGGYNVCLTVTDENGCTSVSCQTVQVADVPISIADAVERAMQVYPNPSNGQFVVEIRGVEADVQLNVLDVAGRVVYTEGAILNGSFRKELNVNVASGTYLLQIVTEEGQVTRRIQIQ